MRVRWVRWLRAGLTVLLASVPSLLSPGVAVAQASSCTTGAYVTDVWNVDPEAGLFAVRVWLWTVCPDTDTEALQSSSLPTADQVERSIYSMTPKGAARYGSSLVR